MKFQPVIGWSSLAEKCRRELWETVKDLNADIGFVKKDEWINIVAD